MTVGEMDWGPPKIGQRITIKPVQCTALAHCPLSAYQTRKALKKS